MNWQTALTNPQQPFLRKSTGFSGRYLNIYPWPVISTINTIKTVAATGSTVVVGAIPTIVSPTVNVFEYPATVSLTAGEYRSSTGITAVDTTGVGILRLDFGSTIAGDIYVEGIGKDSKYNNLDDFTKSIYGTNLPRIPVSEFSRVLTGDGNGPNTATILFSPIAFKPNSETGTAITTITNGAYLYIGSNKPFSNLQFNLSSEDYTRSNVYSLEYWNGGWTGMGGTVYSSVSSSGNTNCIFNQSGLISYTSPADWVKTSFASDPYYIYANQINTRAVTNNGNSVMPTNLIYSASQYWVRLHPPGSNAESVGISSVTIYNNS